MVKFIKNLLDAQLNAELVDEARFLASLERELDTLPIWQGTPDRRLTPRVSNMLTDTAWIENLPA